MFVHLRVHSEFSLVDGLVRLKPLIGAVAALGQPAVAVTDVVNLFGLVKFYRAALAAGVQPIVGADLRVRGLRADGGFARLTLLAQNAVGYRNLTVLLSRAWMEGQDREARAAIDADWLDGLGEGLIALSGGLDGVFCAAGVPERLDALLVERWQRRFPQRFYLEVTRTGRAGEEDWIATAVDAAERFELPIVATNDVRFLHADDFDAHEARVCIHEGYVLADERRPRPYSEQQFLRSSEEMEALFEDLPEAIENSVAIARRCAVTLTLGESVLPAFPVPEGMTDADFLRQTAAEGLVKRLDKARFADDAAYTARLARELDVICQMGFPGYFLIVADFIRWAKAEGIPVGPGRGSGAGSLVAYALEITDLDPLRYELLFERFLNPERVSMPDFDIDFCMEKRDRVIDYVAERYGRDRVSQIITHGTMAAKAVVRDVGRVLGHGYGYVDRIAKLIPFELGITLQKALDDTPELKDLVDTDEDVRMIFDLAQKLEGLTRNAGKHAGGVVIAPSALTDFSALYCEPDGGSLVTHFDKDDVEAVGLVKFDFLGLRTLTILDWALINVSKNSGESIDLSMIPLDDPPTFELLKAYRTTAVFQLESGGMKDLIRRLQPDSFEDIIALVALYRPGPLQSGMVDDFIDRKHGRARVEYPHPELEPILQPTYGVILYQEQVMQIAQVLAGYSLGGADLLRRAMGKKKPEEMAKQREIFLSGALARGVEEATATYIFDLMEKFAGYGFNKSHSAAYALVAYQTAWMKAHHPAAFMAAVLSADMDNTDKVVGLIDECRSMGLAVVPPCVNRSVHRFGCDGDAAVVYGLGAIKGVGESAINAILEARTAGGPFVDLVGFCERVDLGRVNRRVLQTLVRAGALDALGPNRATLASYLDTALAAAEQTARDAALGVVDLFGDAETPVAPPMEVRAEADEADRLREEKEALGLYLTGHPVAGLRDDLLALTGTTLAALAEQLGDANPGRDQRHGDGQGEGRGSGREGRGRRGTPAVIAGLVVGSRMRVTQSGRMMIAVVDDQTGRAEVVLFNDDIFRFRDLLEPDAVIVAEGTATPDEYAGGVRLRARRVLTLDDARQRRAVAIELRASDAATDATGKNRVSAAMQTRAASRDSGAAVRSETQLVDALEATLEAATPGSCRLFLRLEIADAEVLIELGANHRVRPDGAFLRRLRDAGLETKLAYDRKRALEDDDAPEPGAGGAPPHDDASATSRALPESAVVATPDAASGPELDPGRGFEPDAGDAEREALAAAAADWARSV